MSAAIRAKTAKERVIMEPPATVPVHEHDLEYSHFHNYTMFHKCRYPGCEYEEPKFIECQ